jgi:hypothetical protein
VSGKYSHKTQEGVTLILDPSFPNVQECANCDRVKYNSDAVAYWELHKLPRPVIEILGTDQTMVLADDCEWNLYLEEEDIKTARHIQIATEGALYASISR